MTAVKFNISDNDKFQQFVYQAGEDAKGLINNKLDNRHQKLSDDLVRRMNADVDDICKNISQSRPRRRVENLKELSYQLAVIVSSVEQESLRMAMKSDLMGRGVTVDDKVVSAVSQKSLKGLFLRAIGKVAGKILHETPSEKSSWLDSIIVSTRAYESTMKDNSFIRDLDEAEEALKSFSKQQDKELEGRIRPKRSKPLTRRQRRQNRAIRAQMLGASVPKHTKKANIG